MALRLIACVVFLVLGRFGDLSVFGGGCSRWRRSDHSQDLVCGVWASTALRSRFVVLRGNVRVKICAKLCAELVAWQMAWARRN